MSSKFRCILSRLARLRASYRTISVTTYRIPKMSYVAVPSSVGFSIFTWLGFQTKLTPEDELIQTIKHCVLFIQRTEYDKAEQLLHVALRQAQQLNHQLGITYVYDVMANLALEREQLDKAKKLFISVSQRIMADGATEDDSRVIHISVKLARISHLKKEYTTAQIGYDWCLQKLNNCLDKEPNDGIRKLIAMTEDWYGRLFMDNNQFEYALKYMTTSLDHMREIPDIDQEHIVIQLNDIATVCENLGKTEQSVAYLKEAIEIGKKLEIDDLGAIYINLGRIYMKRNMLDEARKNCGYGWKLGHTKKNDNIKKEGEMCLKEIKNMITVYIIFYFNHPGKVEKMEVNLLKKSQIGRLVLETQLTYKKI